MEDRGNIWVEALWITRQESIIVGGVRREISVGMSVKSDYRATTRELYPKLDKALSLLIEEEKAKWLNQEEMKKVNDSLKQKSKTKTRKAKK